MCAYGDEWPGGWDGERASTALEPPDCCPHTPAPSSHYCSSGSEGKERRNGGGKERRRNREESNASGGEGKGDGKKGEDRENIKSILSQIWAERNRTGEGGGGETR